MKKKRNTLTLIEIMLVVILIGIVGGALAFNLKGAVEKGKRFKTEETKKKLDSIINLALLEGNSPENIEENWFEYVKQSPLIKTSSKQKNILDGWGKPFTVKMNQNDYSLVAFSDNIDADEEDIF